MALIFIGKAECGICGIPIEKGEDYVAFPAFIAFTHPLGKFSDGAFHATCFANDPLKNDVEKLYAKYRSIWDSRPRDLKTIEEMESWGRAAFADFLKTDSV